LYQTVIWILTTVRTSNLRYSCWTECAPRRTEPTSTQMVSSPFQVFEGLDHFNLAFYCHHPRVTLDVQQMAGSSWPETPGLPHHQDFLSGIKDQTITHITVKPLSIVPR
jgi:hypothetical protein